MMEEANKKSKEEYYRSREAFSNLLLSEIAGFVTETVYYE